MEKKDYQPRDHGSKLGIGKRSKHGDKPTGNPDYQRHCHGASPETSDVCRLSQKDISRWCQIPGTCPKDQWAIQRFRCQSSFRRLMRCRWKDRRFASTPMEPLCRWEENVWSLVFWSIYGEPCEVICRIPVATFSQRAIIWLLYLETV